MSRLGEDSSGIFSNSAPTIFESRSKRSSIFFATSSIARLITTDASLKPVMNSAIPTALFTRFLDPDELSQAPLLIRISSMQSSSPISALPDNAVVFVREVESLATIAF
eukprot:TRINITY_DN1511_c2_g1_i5.p1 TRINITY_DN1511_c2_g1~~TRINITY_DN1511_c2_g1_i5.p1  ORF type:complete len:109 (-),score=8.00 TRINITY_DN1511_c2_g1_i5:1943-2269(-)